MIKDFIKSKYFHIPYSIKINILSFYGKAKTAHIGRWVEYSKYDTLAEWLRR